MKKLEISKPKFIFSIFFLFILSSIANYATAQLSVWATLASGSGPNYVTVDPSGNVYTQNQSNTTISKITQTGVITATWASPSNTIRGITTDISGRVFVSSNILGGCYVYSSTGSSLGTIITGTGPQGIAADNLGNVYVANYTGGTVSKINSSLSVAANYTIAGGGNGPFCICTDPSGNVYTANYLLNTISKITAGGTLTVAFSTLPAGSGPHGICSDPSGNIYVACNLTNTVVELDPTTGNNLNTWTVGTGPLGICSDNQGNIYVANSGSNSVSMISSAGILSSTWTTTDPVQIAINSSSQTLYVTNQSTGTVSTNTSVLPINLSSFDAQFSNGKVALQWTCQNTINLNYFEVQRSVGNSQFQTIGKVNTEQASLATNYSYLDPSPIGGEDDYRLAMVDLNGNISYSQVKEVSFGDAGQSINLSVWPSPSHLGQQLQISSDYFQGSSKAKIFNSMGQMISSTVLTFQNGTAVLPTQGLAVGTYIILLEGTGSSQTTKFVIQ